MLRSKTLTPSRVISFLQAWPRWTSNGPIGEMTLCKFSICWRIYSTIIVWSEAKENLMTSIQIISLTFNKSFSTSLNIKVSIICLKSPNYSKSKCTNIIHYQMSFIRTCSISVRKSIKWNLWISHHMARWNNIY